jgi:cold shock CspA family protein
MRTHGTLKTWNEAKAFGFIAPADGSADVFVHMTAMPRDGLRPRLGEVLSYEVETGPDGRLRATHVLRPAARAAIAGRAQRRHGFPARVRSIAYLVLLALAAWLVVHLVGGDASSMPPPSTFSAPDPLAAPASPVAGYSCDGRTHCSQMASCEEATWVLRNCPGTKMDGDGDGVPRESQFCR